MRLEILKKYKSYEYIIISFFFVLISRKVVIFLLCFSDKNHN